MLDPALLEADAMLAEIQAQLISATASASAPRSKEAITNSPDASALRAAAQRQSGQFATPVRKAATLLVVPKPLKNAPIQLARKHAATGDLIAYTDCMESSVLRFLQLMLCDLRSLSGDGVPTRIDLELVKLRVKDRHVREYFEEYPDILPPDAYTSPAPGFEARQDWARLVTQSPFFTYKRDTGGVYKNDALLGKQPQRGEWQLELEPCVANIMSVLEHWLGVDFAPCRLQGGAGPRAWEDSGEAHTADVSAEARWYFDFALQALSRLGFELRGHVHPPRKPALSPASTFWVDLDVAVNGAPAWRWVLTRVHLPQLHSNYAQLCARAEDGKPLFITSMHSHIEDHSGHDKPWSWLAQIEAEGTDTRIRDKAQRQNARMNGEPIIGSCD